MAVQSASSSSLSSSTRWWTYDVFLSFRGKDTRQNFTAHLHQALDRKKINIYIDYKLPSGEEISDELLKAIESSRISIVVLSKNYASSRWCLDELLKILECKDREHAQQKVLPVFYHVNPTEVRHQRESFEIALAKLKDRVKDESKVERWKAALTEVAGLSGFTLGDRTEPELIQEIVREVSKVVEPKYLNDVAKHPVGMESRVQDVHDILLRVGVNDTRILGIYGTGGIGKTTLAKAIYNTFTDQFENCCFLANVRETSKSEYGLIKLQETLLCEILGDWSLKVRNKDEGMGQIKKMLWSKRVLLVLDDLDQWDEVEKYLLGGCGWYGLGSVIIITTRDEHLLTRNDVHLRYKVKELDRDEALQLFRWNAFKNANPSHEFLEITENVLDYVGGLPLALMVIGSDLCGRDFHYWESALEKYKRIPHKDIFATLKISYDGLDENEMNIFLDIACFFVGEPEENVTKVLDGCGFSATCGIKVLVDKSLITIDERLVRMHDLLKDMGREIVRLESPKEPEKRSRLWSPDDVRDVLKQTKGTNKIESILLDFPEGHDDKQIHLDPEAFKEMRNLRLFRSNWNTQFSTGPTYLSDKIRVLDWHNYPSSFLPPNFHGTKLMEFRMPNSLIKELDGLKSKNLTVMNLSCCKFLTKIPDLSSSPNLKMLGLQYCRNLVEVHDSVGFLDKLCWFSANGCCKLRILPKRVKLRSLRFWNLNDCSSLEDFPEIECEMKFLCMLWLCRTSIKELPSSIKNLKGLEELHLEGSSLKKLPSSISNLTQLRVLRAKDCDPPSATIFQLQSLRSFKVENIRQVEEDGIQKFYAAGCIDQLQSPSIVVYSKADGYSKCEIGKVEEDGIQSTPSVVSTGKECEIASTSTAGLTPTNSSILSLRFCCLSESNFFTNGNYFPALERLDLSGRDIVIFPPQSVRFASLGYLQLNNCKKLEEILPLPSRIYKVEARECTSLENFALLSEILNKNNGTNFRQYFLKIDVYGCYKLLANMMPIPSWEERHSEEQNREGRYTDIVFPGKMIPSWCSYRKEAHDSNLCEIDINPSHHWNGIDEIVLYVVFGFRVGITNTEKDNRNIFTVAIHDGSNWTNIHTEGMTSSRMDNSDHVWMLAKSCRKLRDVSRFRFKCDADFAVFRRVGIHFPKKHEENVRDEDHTGVLYETPFKDFSLDFMDDNENPEEDLELENDDENPREGFGKRRCHDEYDCNLELNLYPQQKRQHSSTMGIRITELENDDEHPKEDMDLELKLG